VIVTLLLLLSANDVRLNRQRKTPATGDDAASSPV